MTTAAAYAYDERCQFFMPQNPIGGQFTEDQQKQLKGVKERVEALLKNSKCADVLGGTEKALKLLNGAQIFSANTINPAYKGPGYGVAQTARELALGTNTTVAHSEVPGNRIYLFNRFFDINTSPLPDPIPSGGVTRSRYSQETVFIHELNRNAGYNGLGIPDQDRIEAACGTKPSYEK